MLNNLIKNNLNQIGLSFEITNFCLNKCNGCVYNEKERNKKMSFPVDKYELIIKAFYEASSDNDIIIKTNLGPAETFFISKEDFKQYIDISYKHFELNKTDYNNLFSFEVNTTLKMKDFKEKFIYLINLIEDKNIDYDFLLEFVFDPTLDEKSLRNIKNNIELISQYTNDFESNEKVQFVNVVAFTKQMYETNPELIIQNIKKYGIKRIDLQYIFIANYDLPNFEDFYRYYLELKKYGDLYGITFQNDLYKDNGDHNENELRFQIKQDFKAYKAINNPFCDFIYTLEEPLDFSLITEENVSDYRKKIQKVFINHIINNKIKITDEECLKCNSLKKCFPYYNLNLKKKYGFEHKKDKCFGNYDLV